MPQRTLSARTHRARELRREQTPAEDALWGLLRGRQLAGLKFRRQVPVGIFIADFLCERLKLIVEVDGEIHRDSAQADHDANRSAHLRERGYTVVRFGNDQVLSAPASVLRELERWMRR